MLSACAGIPADRGFDEVVTLVDQRGGPQVGLREAPSEVDRMVEQLLAEPLSAEAAVQVALLRNPRLRVEYARLGIAQAELYDAARLSNPRLSAAVLDSSEPGAANQLTLGLAQNFANLLFLGARKDIANATVRQAQQQAAAEVLNLAREVEAAYYEALGAGQLARLRGLVANAAELSAKLAQRFYAAGNINRLELQLENAAATRARLNATQAAAQAEVQRNALNQMLGLRADQAGWTLRDRLPTPVSEEDSPETLNRLAAQRLDLAAMVSEVTALERALGINRRYRYLGEFEVGVEYEREADRSRLLGPTAAIELPIFNQGDGRILRAQAQLEQSRARLQALEIAISNEVALACKKVQVARELVTRYREQFIPQREEVVQRMQELQSYMIVEQFELLRVKQDEYDAYQGYIEALRDYWLARNELSRAVGAALPSDQQIGADTLDLDALAKPGDGAAMRHGMHGMQGMQMDHADEDADMSGMDGMHDMHDMQGMEGMHDMKQMHRMEGMDAGEPQSGMRHRKSGAASSAPSEDAAPPAHHEHGEPQ